MFQKRKEVGSAAAGGCTHLRPVAVQVGRRVGVGEGLDVGVALQRLLEEAGSHIVAAACACTHGINSLACCGALLQRPAVVS